MIKATRLTCIIAGIILVINSASANTPKNDNCVESKMLITALLKLNLASAEIYRDIARERAIITVRTALDKQSEQEKELTELLDHISERLQDSLVLGKVLSNGIVALQRMCP